VAAMTITGLAEVVTAKHEIYDYRDHHYHHHHHQKHTDCSDAIAETLDTVTMVINASGMLTMALQTAKSTLWSSKFDLYNNVFSC